MMNWFLIHLMNVSTVFARGGGGGSSSGGGGGGSSSGGGSHGSGGGNGGFYINIVVFLFILGVYLFQKISNKRMLHQKTLKPGDFSDDPLKQRVATVFYAFQEAWSTYRADTMQEFATLNYCQRMNLELNVLYALHRQNLVNNPRLLKMSIALDNSKASFIATIQAVADDILMDTALNRSLFTDKDIFEEYWHFVNDNGVWKLDLITQATEEAVKLSPEIKAFAETNNFYFDPDFGWLMIPQKGAIFSKSNFKNSDINNHVIGSYRNKIVQFYTFNPNTNQGLFQKEYTVAQTVIPSQYRDILVTRKRLWNWRPKGMIARKLESPDFNAKFSLFADPLDQVSAWVLLSPTFMEKISHLEFELNIEVIGNIIYFYTKDLKVHYGEMLEILSWAFDEMK